MTDNDSLKLQQSVMPLDPLTMPLRGMQVLEASAGTGKTWMLAALYVRLVIGHDAAGLRLGEGLMPSQILVMTFTDAATAELRGRIRERLAQAARWFRCGASVPQVDLFLQDLRSKIAQEQWSACAERLVQAAQSMNEAAIFTIHGWSSRMLTQHAFDSASLFRQSRVEDSKSLKLAAVQDYWRTRFYPLAPAQLAALDAMGGTPAEWLDKLLKVCNIEEKAPTEPQAAPEPPDALIRSWECWSEQFIKLDSCARGMDRQRHRRHGRRRIGQEAQRLQP